MSFYIRKSLRAGPFRFNLSKSGIGVSAGITGFRVGTGPRGNYVHIGRGGLYYKRTIPSKSPTVTRETFQPGLSNVLMKEIESVDVLEMQDSSSEELLVEINNKHKKQKLFPLVAIPLIAWLSIYYLIVQSPTEIRGLSFLLFCFGTPPLLLITATTGFLAYRHDQISKTVILFYELEGAEESSYQAFHDSFQELVKCSRAWRIRAQGKVSSLHEWKINAGASTLIDRTPIRFTFQNPPYVSTNLTTPAILTAGKTLYFFPDRILIYGQGKVGALSYTDLKLAVSNFNMIEAQGVPPDTMVIDYTWRFVNKDGSPDRRFNNNRRIPIVVYSELYFTSKNGLNELLQVSKPNAGIALAENIRNLALVTKPEVRFSADKSLEQAINAIRLGDKKTAYQLLIQVINANPTDKNAEKAWLWMSKVVNDPQRKRQCFETVLQLNPDNAVARKALTRIEATS